MWLPLFEEEEWGWAALATRREVALPGFRPTIKNAVKFSSSSSSFSSFYLSFPRLFVRGAHSLAHVIPDISTFSCDILKRFLPPFLFLQNNQLLPSITTLGSYLSTHFFDSSPLTFSNAESVSKVYVSRSVNYSKLRTAAAAFIYLSSSCPIPKTRGWILSNSNF